MPVIHRHELVDLLLSQRGAFPATIEAVTEVRLPKKSPLFGTRKVARVNGIFNFLYESAVNRQREREGQPLDSSGNPEPFQAAPRQWGERIRREDGTVTPLVRHKDRYYLEMKVEKSLGHSYHLHNAILDNKEIEELLGKKEEGGRQEVASPVLVRDYSIDSIRTIRMCGELYEVID